MSDFQDHFAPQAAGYAAFRPGYPAWLIAAVAALAPARRCCWDVGTGSGQAAVLLAEHFAQVQATDASASQLAHALPHPRVHYRVAPAEQSPLPDASVDLVTVAQALHWFATPEFFREVQRVAAPGAAFAAWSYGLLRVDAAVDAVIGWFYEERLGAYWPPERRHVEEGYRSLAIPFAPLALPVGGRDLALEAPLDRAALVGYLGTWSALKRAREVEATDPLAELLPRLAAVWPDAAVPRTVRWPLVVVAGRI